MPSRILADAVFQSRSAQGGTEYRLLGVDAGEDRAIGRLGPVGNQPGDACRHALCLFHIALISGSGNARAGFAGGHQFQVILTVRRGRKHPVGEVHDFRRRTIVGVEIDIGGERPEFIGETQQIPAGGTGKRVDGLGRIAHDAYVAVHRALAVRSSPAQPQGQQPVLQGRDVLILVDGEPADGGTNLGGGFGKIIHDMAYEQQNIVKIDFATRGLFLLVGAVDVGEPSGVESGGRLPMGDDTGPCIIFHRHQRDFGPIDFGEHIANGQRIGIGTCGGADDRAGDDVTLIFDHMREWSLAYV